MRNDIIDAMRHTAIAILSALHLLAFFAAGAAPEARVLPFERAAWEKYHPLGGEFVDGRYVSLHEQAPSFEVSRLVPPSANLAAEATFTPERKAAKADGTAAISIFESPGHYWDLALYESKPGKRSIAMSERSGTSQVHSALKVEADIGAGATWEWGRAYSLRIALDGKGVQGEVRDAESGELLFRRRYALEPGHIASGRPAFRFNRIIGNFSGIKATVNEADSHRATEAQRSSSPSNHETNLCGSVSLCEENKKFYRTTRAEDGRWWFVDPDGKRFFLSGIGVVSHNGFFNSALGYAPYARTVARKYPTLDDWATNSLARIRSWGFNFLSSPSAILLRRGFPHAHVINIGQNFACYGDEFDILPCDGGPCSGFPNVFHPLFKEYCRFRVRSFCTADRDDPWTLGWYIDNELSWWGDKRKFKTPPARGLFDAAARKAPDHPARKALEAFLEEWNNSHKDTASHRGSLSTNASTNLCVSVSLCDIENIPAEVTREFVRLVARKYFEATTAAIREVDPNHLILGCRFAGFGSADPVVWEECGRFCDAISVNSYPMVDLDRGIAVSGFAQHDRPIADIIRERARPAGKPVIMTEWGFSALDSGLPCTHGAGQRFFTQRERAEATSIFARTMWALPECAGYVYFMWCDEPAVGKNGPKSENTNYGLVNADDEPYEEQVAALSAVQLHPEESRHAPLPEAREVVPPSAAEMASRFGRVESQDISIGVASSHGAQRGIPIGGGTLTLALHGHENGAFEADVRLHRIAGRPFVLAELLAVRNCGVEPMTFDAATFQFLPADEAAVAGTAPARGDDVFAPPADGQPTPIPPMLWRPWQSGAWVLPDGNILGMLSPRTGGVSIKFRKDDALHGDAEYKCGSLTLAPGGEWTPQHAPFVIAAALSGGEDAWRDLCAEIRAAATFQTPATFSLTIDPSRILGPVKPVNGVGQPPILGLRKYSMFRYLKEAGVPFSRLHDVGGMFGRGIFVDIPNLFHDFDADENDPANYDFTFTDILVNALVENGVEPFFRLGVTLENYATIRRYRIDPPKDYAKWARICEHVIRHYTEGWADGFHHTVTHWEIWNEPDNWDDPEQNESWHGTFEDYCRLYETASKHLKAKFPHLKIGGPASCGVAYLTGWDVPRAKHHLDCFHAFLRYVREHDCPLDFFSWHSYSTVESTMAQARYIREKLDEAGFAGVPSVLDEWLPEPDHDKLGTAEQAAEIAAGLIAMQNGPVDAAAIYDARCSIGKYSVLFNPLTYEPHKAYWAFMAFNELRKCGMALDLGTQPRARNIRAAAAKGVDGAVAVMLANTGDEEAPFAIECADDNKRTTARTCRIVDAWRTWEEIPLPAALPPHSFILAHFSTNLTGKAQPHRKGTKMNTLNPNVRALVAIDQATIVGPVKPMHAVNNGPAVKKPGGDQVRGNFDEYKAARIPFARTHDSINCVSGGAHTCDINAIFPDFDADENDPANYDFVFTDHYLDNIRRAGTQVFFRLGQTIEHGPKKYGVLPPKDFAKWARICEHVIRHYNEGWGWGVDKGWTTKNIEWSNQFGIEYWEIWNEPDLDPSDGEPPRNPRCWGGTTEEFFRFFETAAKYLKAKFPHLKIGGPALCGRLDWGERFLAYCRDHEVPLDFFSWHVYATEPKTIAGRCDAVRALMDKYGFNKAESILNEWNYVKGWTDDFVYSLEVESGRFNQKSAAFVMSAMIDCQWKPLDMLMFYDSRVGSGMNNLFNATTLWPMKGYYPFYAWSKLAALGTQVACEVTDGGAGGGAAGDGPATGVVLDRAAVAETLGLRAVAAKGANGSGAAIVARYSEDNNVTATICVAISVPGADLSRARCHVTDAVRTFTEVPLDVQEDGTALLRMQPNSFAVVEW